ncbi:Uncharacterised protein [Mycobacteroides abscessus subsp. abscessus]|nr:Uncharacterised protein [Mycobacteroides abscessus subsp. abscessus]
MATPASVGVASPASKRETSARAAGESFASATAPTMLCPCGPQAAASGAVTSSRVAATTNAPSLFITTPR